MLVNVYGIHQPTPPQFAHRLVVQRDQSDPAFADHVAGLGGWAIAMAPPASALSRELFHFIEAVQFHWAFELDETDVLPLRDWCIEHGALIFIGDELASSLNDPSLRLLVSDTGAAPDPAAMIPLVSR